MDPMNRRKFIARLSKLTGGVLVGGYVLDSTFFSAPTARASIVSNVFVARNGTPEENIAKVIEMRFGGVENFIGYDDVVVINPNGQWPNQGATNCASCMAMIELILNRPGGFGGEIVFCENTQFQSGYWTASGTGLDRNGPYNYLDMIDYFQSNGHNNVNAVRILGHSGSPQEWPVVTGPEQGQGWVRPEWQSPTDGTLFYLSYPIFRSPYSNRLIDMRNGIWDGGFESQSDMKFIKMPTLNNHGDGAEQDYAGITSAVKSHLGMTDCDFSYPSHECLHAYSSYYPISARVVGEAIGAWMNHCRPAHIYLTSGEWVGWESRTSAGATNARTVGLADDPVSLDYYMSRHVLLPLCPQQQYFDPDFDLENNRTGLTIDGCLTMGYGTRTEEEIAAFVYDFASPRVFRFEIDRKIREFRAGQCTQQDVLNLIDTYNDGD